MELLRLIGLKNIFARQLPNMPKEYIVRLVMDRYLQLLHVIFLGGEKMRLDLMKILKVEGIRTPQGKIKSSKDN